MKKIILYILLGVVAVVLLIKVIHGTSDYGSKAVVEVPSSEEYKAVSIKNVTFLIDNSGSMRGYVDFSGNKPEFASAEKTLLSKTGIFMGNCENILDATTKAICNGKTYNTEKTMTALSNYSAFSGPITEVGSLIKKGIDTLNGDSTLCVIVSDMVLSYGKAELKAKSDIYYNLHSLSDLKTDIRNQFHRLKNAGKDVLIVKYEGDFNGNFYYNYTENLEASSYQGTLMNKRPFYFMIIGATKAIKDLCVRKCLPEGYTEVFTSLALDKSDIKTESYSVTQPSDQPQWILGCPDNRKENDAKDNTFTISIDKNLSTTRSSFSFQFSQFEIPAYVSTNLSAEYERNVLKEVTQLVNNSSFSVTTNPFNDLSKRQTVKVRFVSPRYVDVSTSSTKDDIKCSVKDMEGKTWGYAAIAEALYEAYGISSKDVNQVVSLEFMLIKN
ncbi:MAG: hypothetical protein K2H46_03470 [Muribaculaceae bacterium]|nr:hypothetical protein [Muribaculaceae bacterium]